MKFADDAVVVGLNTRKDLDEVERLSQRCLLLNVNKTKELVVDIQK